MTYQTAFPDFDRREPIDMLIAAGWADESWANDGCPRVHCGDAAIWIDYADDSKRVCEVAPPFFVQYLVDGCFSPDNEAEEFETVEAALGAIYVKRIGYDPFADDPAIAAAEVAETLVGHQAEGDKLIADILA